MIFTTPLLLIGLAAAAIPPLLHLLARTRSRPQTLPTLRFLRETLQKTSRRRTIEHWLLLLLRSALLAGLALAVAEPILRAAATGGVFEESELTLLLDTSYSQATTLGPETRFTRAKAAATQLLSGQTKPAQAELITAAGASWPGLTDRLDILRTHLSESTITLGPAGLPARLDRLADELPSRSHPNRWIVLISDLQRTTMDQLVKSRAWDNLAEARLIVIDTGGEASPHGGVDNVGIESVELIGRAIVGQTPRLRALLRNSSPQPRTVELQWSLGDPSADPAGAVQRLAPAGEPGSTAEVSLPIRLDTPGPIAGLLRLAETDDLPVDNLRHVALDVGEPIEVLIVRGPSPPGINWWIDPAWMLAGQFTPPADDDRPWSFRVRQVDAAELTPADLDNAEIAFFCEVARLNPTLTRAVEQFVARGGTAAFFLGPEVQLDAWNTTLARPGGLLPPLAPPTGQLGPDAPVRRVTTIDHDDDLLAGLFDTPADYLAEPLLVQRAFGLTPPDDARVLMQLEDGTPLLLVRPLGQGRVMLATAPATMRWSPNLPTHGLMLPLMHRLALSARPARDAWRTFSLGRSVHLDVGSGPLGPIAAIELTSPASEGSTQIPVGPDGHVMLDDLTQPGVYRWSALGADKGGLFAVNPFGPECNLPAMPHDELAGRLQDKGLAQVVLATSVADAHAQIDQSHQGRNLWDVLAGAVILLLLLEAALANRAIHNRRSAEPISQTTAGRNTPAGGS